MQIKRTLFLLLSIIFFFFGCTVKKKGEKYNSISKEHIVKIDLPEIQKRGTIIAITGYNAYSYFIYKGQPMGYEYELLQRLAKALNVKLEIKVVRSIDEMIEMLNSGKGDIIAYNLTVTKERQKRINFALHHTTTRQVLVQRKPKNWRKMKLHQITATLLHSPIDLIGKKITVVKGSSHITRLKHLSEEIGSDLNIVEADDTLTSRDLVEMVADGKIDYTVEDENIAKLYQLQHPNIDISMPLSLPQRIAWGVRKTSPLLLKAINKWLTEMKKKTEYYVIYKKYFESRKSFKQRLQSEYFSLTGGHISAYDNLIKKAAKKIGWDWRLLASLIYQESQFHPHKTSWAGAKGLMQLMPATGKEFGAKNLLNPEQSIEAGSNYLKWLSDFWAASIPDSTERIKFVIASYNIGHRHVSDARKLAKKYGANPNIWFNNVEKFLLKKSDPKFYNDPVVKYGYAIGKETVKYVREIFDRYEHYKQFIK